MAKRWYGDITTEKEVVVSGLDANVSATILADSINPDGTRLTTFVLQFPRIILAEVNTHRISSKNTSSSRAVPVTKMIQRIEERPYVPTVFYKNGKGMQAVIPMSLDEQEKERQEWMNDLQYALSSVRAKQERGLHKAYANRILEPFMFCTQIHTATSFDNMFNQRLRVDDQGNPLAQMEFFHLCSDMKAKLSESEPTLVPWGEWHVPFSSNMPSKTSRDDMLKIATARCARVSFYNHDGCIDIQNDLRLFGDLLRDEHPSPFEHIAQADSLRLRELSRNFAPGWAQFRAYVETFPELYTPEQPVPEYVLDALEDIRDSGLTNMWVSEVVIDLMVSDDFDHALAQDWLDEHPRRYVEALKAMGDRRVREGKVV